ncbi:MAG TPA: peptidylprolyl isomerase [Candidatus Nanoarchaeia archaeon]|nr:peptidylprolyl isomerase [Candidatus Nanoarchaeia archaeon]
MKKVVFGIALLFLFACAQQVAQTENSTNAYGNEAANGGVRCTMEVKVCPDGTEVSRSGPTCDFAQCPETNSTIQANTTNTSLEGETMKRTKVSIETTMGTMVVELYDDKAPLTVDNFKKLVGKGFYDGTIFHRVIKDFMIQGGDPKGTGTGGPGYTIKDEFGHGLKHDKKGVLSMANAGPNTGGSQFFITLVPTSWLDGKHAIFGHIVEGEDVLDKIGSTPTNPGDRPKTEVKIVEAQLIE